MHKNPSILEKKKTLDSMNPCFRKTLQNSLKTAIISGLNKILVLSEQKIMNPPILSYLASPTLIIFLLNHLIKSNVA